MFYFARGKLGKECFPGCYLVSFERHQYFMLYLLRHSSRPVHPDHIFSNTHLLGKTPRINDYTIACG